MKEIIGAIAVGLSIFSLLPYIIDILKKKTKPHLYSWLVWTPLTFFAYFSQLAGNAGPGAWTTGITAVLCLAVLTLTLFRGSRDITYIDNLSLLGVIVAALFWFYFQSPLATIIWVTTIDALGFVPTIRKSYKTPFEETLLTHILSVAKHLLSVLAITNLSFLTAVYPVTIGIANIILVLVLLRQRKAISAPLI